MAGWVGIGRAAQRPARSFFLPTTDFRRDNGLLLSAAKLSRRLAHRKKGVQTAKSAPGLGPVVTIMGIKACREGGTLAVPFQDRDHGMMMDHHIMIFFCARPLP